MDREAFDFRRTATAATSSAEPAAAEGRTLSMRDRLYARERNPGQGTTQHVVPREAAPRSARDDRNIQTVTIQSILKGAREAIIDFDGAAYRLRITRNHRLILTK